MHTGDTDFEFERRFLVTSLPHHLLEDNSPDIIVQTYFLAKDGYGLRVRLQATQPPAALPLDIDGKAALHRFADEFDLCMLTVKGPNIGGTRYEAERPIDIGVGVAMCARGGTTLAKRRYGVWLGADGWVIDEFCGENRPLVVAECERTSPVVDLESPHLPPRRSPGIHAFQMTNWSTVPTPCGWTHTWLSSPAKDHVSRPGLGRTATSSTPHIRSGALTPSNPKPFSST